MSRRNSTTSQPLDEKGQENAAFTVQRRGLFQFTCMPFGLSNAPATFQRSTHKVINPGLKPHAFAHLVEVTLVSETFDDNLKLLKEVLGRLTAAALANWLNASFTL